MQRTLTHISFALLASHLLCCGVPLVLGILNITSLAGISVADALHFEWYEAIELPVLFLSFGLLVLAFYLQHAGSKVHSDAHGCEHTRCATTMARSRLILWAGAGLFALNLVVFLLSQGTH